VELISKRSKGISMFKSLLASVVFLSTNAFAQTAAAAPAQNPLMQFLPLVVVFVIFYFLMIRPQKKKYDEEQALLGKLSKGDEIYTKSGLIGTIYGMTDTVVTLEVSEGVRFKVLKSQIAGLYKTLVETATAKK
jgi:preprotein translocase subunit YajC